jgi:TBC domain-containing protein kinase-like protein
MPLEKVYQLWDSLLPAPPTFPLFVAVAILRELRSLLLPLDFNACILFFSHLPELDIAEIVRNAFQLLAGTPTAAATCQPALRPSKEVRS